MHQIFQSTFVCYSRIGRCNVQLLRSASTWSIGFKERHLEKDIQNAYIHCITNAKHFIYIENQYFISHYDTSDCPVKNKIVDAIYDRIVKAHREEEAKRSDKKFKVYIVLPLYPGFFAYIILANEGDFEKARESAILRTIVQYERLTIGYDNGSLFGRLIASKINPDDYISVFGLRTHACVNNKPITEMVYVHSKCFVIDDKYALIGSANINDRSMLGDRDSELAVL